MNPVDTKFERHESSMTNGTNPRVRMDDPVLDPSRATRLIQEATSDTGWLVREVRSVEVVSDRADRRRTLRFRLTARRAGGPAAEISWYGRQYRGSEGERVAPILRFLRAAAAPDIRIPAPLGYSREARLLLMSESAGRPLSGALEDPIESRVAASLKRLGRSLASFHSIRSPGPSARSAERPSFGRWDAFSESLALDEAENQLLAAGVEPRIAERLREGCAALRADITKDAGVARAPSMVHRQLSPSHVIFGADGISLVDLDEAAFGEPEHDLGNLVAHLILWDLKRGTSARLAPGRAEALRAGYLGGGALRPNRLAAYTSAALLRLATSERTKNGGVGAPDWTRLTAVLIEEALPEAVRV